MTTATATDRSLAAEGSLDDLDVLDFVRTPAGILMAVILAGAVATFFNAWILKQFQLSINNVEDWGHALLVPLISVYILWQYRDDLKGVKPRVFWPALAPLTFGIMAYPFFIAGVSNHLGQGLALVLTIFSVILLITGPRVMKTAFMPISYLVFAITLPEMVMIKITFQLQRVASIGSYFLLNTFGIDTSISGNVLTITKANGTLIPLNVAQQCSGMRTLVAFIALGTAVALVACRHWWQRVAVILLAFPVAIAINVVRVTALGVASLWNPALASGQAHTFIGTLLLIPALFLFMGIVWALNRCVRDDVTTGSTT